MTDSAIAVARRTCAEQAVPERLEDLAVVEQVAALLTQPTTQPPAKRATSEPDELRRAS